MARIEIEDICNADVEEVTVSTGNTIELILHYILKCVFNLFFMVWN